MPWFRNFIQLSTTFSKQSPSPSPRRAAAIFVSRSPSLTQLLRHFSSGSHEKYPGLGPTKGDEKPRVVVLGSGWAGCRLIKDIDTKIYDVVCVSPRNHMVFTPLLASTCVGTLEFRSVAEPIGRIQPAISREPGSYFFLANCTGVDFQNHQVHCQTVTEGVETLDPWNFKVSYDKLVIASGAQASTFGIRGANEHATFLREVHHAQEIRRKLLLNLMLSDVPGITDEEKHRLLHCVVVGGGPTGVEFSGELSDFIQKDVHQRYAHVKDYIRVTLVEANEILSSFDDRLRKYAIKQLIKSGVRLVRGIVKDVQADKIILSDDTEIPYGVLVWSTGVGPSPFVNSLEIPKAPGGRIGIDEWQRVPSVQDVFAIGDCSGFLESTGRPVLPALAQVAERQGKYIAKLLNRLGKAGGGRADAAKELDFGSPFVYRHLGSMATIGRYKALVDLRQSKEGKGLSLAGFISWFIWRSAYLTRVVSWRNRFYVAINWLTTFVFGRDISRI
ncbi:Internal alternative NAD(P)H-ubiquinone oxidoreductase A1, mitochondrial [Sesamum alatum]|uniref:Internal alternative NAD(P)H-ubiquinone oxidoreductase A1, mitochondrial n=1 Tax=Sesamum alatum TaxID=300844 RepID=A0AAE2D0H0_9LAMI|nr:Internal alternative NAD(P)H-ubiquinone oxidoreductase A1, mitochondrial [Sesamum alatum]